MRKIVVTTVMLLLFIAPLTVVSPAKAAAGDVLVYTDQTITFSTPSTSLTILASSTLDSMIVNPDNGTIDFVISANGSTTLLSTDKKILSFSSSSLAEDYVTNICDSSASSIQITNLGDNVDGATFKITVGSGTCTSADTTTTVTSGGGGGGGGGAAPAAPSTPVTAEETTTETPATTEETATTSEIPGTPATDASGKVTLGQMAADAFTVASGDVSMVTAKMGVNRDATAEAEYNNTIVAKIVSGSGITAQARNTINNFVTYGTPATKVLGAGERAGVVNSYRSAFGKLPATTEEWNDVIKIANGRWPNERSEAKENTAKTSFKTIYLRQANMDDPHDNAAVTVMAYGLRPADRNLNSEKTAIKSFKAIFGYNPSSATNWDAVRAIAYSGATR